MMRYVWLAVFVVSSASLLIALITSRQARKWLAGAALHVVAAAFLLYFINLFGAQADFHIPINVTTVATVIVLGVPGLILLAALKFVLF